MVFEELLRGVDGFDRDWKAVVRHESPRDIVELRVEADVGQSVVEKLVLGNLRESFADFWKNHEMGLYELRVVTCRSGSLRNGGRKLRRVIDERPMLEDRA